MDAVIVNRRDGAAVDLDIGQVQQFLGLVTRRIGTCATSPPNRTNPRPAPSGW